MLGINGQRKDFNACLVCKGNWIFEKTTLLKARFSPCQVWTPPVSLEKIQVRKWGLSQRNVRLLKIKAKSLRDGSQDICKDTENNLPPFAAF